MLLAFIELSDIPLGCIMTFAGVGECICVLCVMDGAKINLLMAINMPTDSRERNNCGSWDFVFAQTYQILFEYEILWPYCC